MIDLLIYSWIGRRPLPWFWYWLAGGHVFGSSKWVRSNGKTIFINKRAWRIMPSLCMARVKLCTGSAFGSLSTMLFELTAILRWLYWALSRELLTIFLWFYQACKSIQSVAKKVSLPGIFDRKIAKSVDWSKWEELSQPKEGDKCRVKFQEFRVTSAI